jgi:hypothetical protein
MGLFVTAPGMPVRIHSRGTFRFRAKSAAGEVSLTTLSRRRPARKTAIKPELER